MFIFLLLADGLKRIYNWLFSLRTEFSSSLIRPCVNMNKIVYMVFIIDIKYEDNKKLVRSLGGKSKIKSSIIRQMIYKTIQYITSIDTNVSKFLNLNEVAIPLIFNSKLYKYLKKHNSKIINLIENNPDTVFKKIEIIPYIESEIKLLDKIKYNKDDKCIYVTASYYKNTLLHILSSDKTLYGIKFIKSTK